MDRCNKDLKITEESPNCYSDTWVSMCGKGDYISIFLTFVVNMDAI